MLSSSKQNKMKRPMKFKTPTVGKLLTSSFVTPNNENISTQNASQKSNSSQDKIRKAPCDSLSTPINKTITSCNLEADSSFNLDSATVERKKANAKALMMGNIRVERKPFMANGMLSCGVHKKFKPPGDPSTYSKSMTKKLGGCGYSGKGLLKAKFSSGGSAPRPGYAPKLQLSNSVNSVVSSDGDLSSDSESDEETPEFLPHEPLVVWEPTSEGASQGEQPVQVPKVLAQFLRPHQRAGVEFCSECLLGMKDFEGNGCILADDMGLGKTLQSITLLYTLMRNVIKPGDEGKLGKPIVKRTIVVCPCSLVNNWAQEFEKWINGRVKTEAEKVRACPIAATDKKSVLFSIAQFLHPSHPFDVLIISYETFRLYVKKFTKKNDMCCDLLICDEAHRLKNPDALTTKALASLACRKRVLLSGTPVQNDLDEFFAMADFTNPGVLGTNDEFRKRYKNPILVGREPGASQKEADRAKVLQNEMSSIVNQFIIRRMNAINAKFLPDKLVQVVCCKLTDTQKSIYRQLIASKDITAAVSGKIKDALSYIQMMQKLCNHPKILETSCGGKSSKLTLEQLSLFGVRLDRPDDDFEAKMNIFPELSGKMMVLHNLMDVMWKDQTPKRLPERIVVISIYTQTLDLVERMCKGKKWPVVRLDGSLAVKKRMELVNAFNDEKNRNAFCFLLSSKAGGCGINLIGANRLVLFDSDWNPATDKQAAARCWRDGQKKNCFTYRFLSAGSLEEKIFQRQLSKEGLASVVEDKEQVNSLSSNDLKQLFKFRDNTPSDTHDKLKCTHCRLALEEAEDSCLGEAQISFINDVIEWMKILPESKYFLGGDPSPVAQPTPGDLSVVEPNDDTTGATVSVVAKVKSKAKMTDLVTIQAKLLSGGFLKLTEFHKEVRNLLAAARKNYDIGTPERNDADSLREQFEERWLELAPQIQCLQAGDARVFTEEELAGASAAIMSHSASSSSSAGRMGGRSFNKPFRPKPKQFSVGGGVSAGGASSLSSASPLEIEKVVKRRASLSQPPFKPQHEMPKEEDLNNWSHHFSVETIEDEYLKKATQGTDLVSFIFGLNVTWDLTQKQTALDEQREADDKERKDNDLELAKSRLDSKHKKRKTIMNNTTDPSADKENQEEILNVANSEEGDEIVEVEDTELSDDITTEDPRVSTIEELDDVDIEQEQHMMQAAEAAVEPSGATCPSCTLINQPSAKQCEACATKLPKSIKAKKGATSKTKKRSSSTGELKEKKKSKKINQSKQKQVEVEVVEETEPEAAPAPVPVPVPAAKSDILDEDSDFE